MPERLTQDAFVERASEVHNKKYDYSKTKYIRAHAKVLIICPIHGKFWQSAWNHLSGFGCQNCAKQIAGTTRTHGLSQHPVYSVWLGVLRRCTDKDCDGYKDYGARGIKIADEFKSVECFIDYITSLPRYEDREKLSLTLDRVNNNGNYERGNLRWATYKEQSQNKRVAKKTEYRGVHVSDGVYRGYVNIKVYEGYSEQETIDAIEKFVKELNLVPIDHKKSCRVYTFKR